ncbi:hypothetical protein K458DRAFT_411128 [Lentithecium fluviatile CBS 122367]|uniref:PD-(D/E)XK nuclease-like domain-containing protein n=1 Tax=Lentithecium fluviatile CBS 122367 TaxID=1168545 RepID=A0A6G1IBJ1_9PLEO|nr:hypothetical protein K458DRAFT_411128 [Lentithecium fluviatile CBS 122367]
MPTAKEPSSNTGLCWRFTQKLDDVQTAGHTRHNGTPKCMTTSCHAPCDPSNRALNLLIELQQKPITDFAPLYKGDPSGPKIVDFSINFVPARGSSLESAIHTLLHEPPQLLSVNQTLNEAYKKLAVVSIETKEGFYEEEDAKFKLGMWTAAWQNRVATFRRTEKVVCTPLPGLIVFGHEWWLYWAVDQGTRVDIIEFPISIGCTRTVTGCY